MTDTKETRSSPIGLRVTPSMKAAIDKAADDDHRPVASFIEKVLADYLRDHGYMPKPKGKK